MFKFLTSIDRGIEKLASGVLVLCMALILSMSVSMIALRWMHISFLWFDPLIRHLVFLSAFMGGVVATGRKTHIGIDIIGRYFESQKKKEASRWVERITSVTSLLTLALLTKFSLDFVSLEAKYGKDVFLGIHSKFLVAIIPLGMSLMAYRFFHLFISSFSRERE